MVKDPKRQETHTRTIMEIKPYPKNAKKHPKKQIEQVANSIKEFGMNQPIVVDKQGVIIVGHGRYEALKSLGVQVKDEYIKVVDLTEEQAKAYRLADNKLNESEWDMDLVIEELKDLSEPMLELTGFDKDLIIEPDEKDDELPDVPEEPQSKLGDLYELGEHRVLCGDSTKIEDVERLMNGKKADMSFTSPPYNAGKSEELSGNTHTKDNKYQDGYNDDNPEYQKLITDTTLIALDYAKESFVNLQILAGNKKQILLWLAELSDVFKDIFFWKKQTAQPAMAANVANSQTELILLFGRENTSRSWGNQRFRGTFSNTVETKSASGENKNSKIHAATYPVDLPMKFIVEGYSKGSLILDLFSGTGTTLIAAEKTGRICYGMELDEKYIDVIIERWCQFTGIRNIKKNGQDYYWEAKE